MSENQTQFFIKDSNYRIMTYFKDFLDGENEYCDLTIVSSEKIELKCHKAVLATYSFFKVLFQAQAQYAVSKIILPNYRHDTIYLLLQFLYCGEILVPAHLIVEFADICLEFNLDSSISEVNSFVQAHKSLFPHIPLQLDNKSALAAYESETEQPQYEVPTIIKTEDSLDDIVQIYDELVESDEDIMMKEDKIIEENDDIKQQLIKGDNENPLAVEVDDDYVFDLIEYDNSMEKPEKINYKNPKGIGLNPLYERMLKRACMDVMERGTSYLTASRTYGISRSVIHRHVKKLKNATATNENANFSETPSSSSSLLKLKTKNIITEGHRRKDPLFSEKLQSAVNDVLYNGSSFWSAQKKSGITRSVIHRHVQKAKQVMAQNDSVDLNPVNIGILREELQDFKQRLQRAITTCRNDGVSVQEAAKLYDVPELNIERNLYGVRSS